MTAAMAQRAALPGTLHEDGYELPAGLPFEVRHAELVTEKRRIVREVKLARGCVDCGYNTHPRALQFDHRPGRVKRGVIARMATSGVPMATLLAEIDKCDVRCANCHAIKTAERPPVERRPRRRMRAIP